MAGRKEDEGQGVPEILMAILAEQKVMNDRLEAIEILSTPANSVTRNVVQVNSTTQWIQVAKLPSDIMTWTLYNPNSEDTDEVLEWSYSNSPDPNAIFFLRPFQEVSGDTRPDYIFCKRSAGAAGTAPNVIIEFWQHGELKLIGEKPKSTLGPIGSRQR